MTLAPNPQVPMPLAPCHTATALVASTVQAPPPPKERSQTLTIAMGILLIGGLVALMLVISLRLIRRVAEGSPLAAERQKKRKPRGAGRDPWREAGRRLVVPPKEHGEGEQPPDDSEPTR